MKIGLQVPYFTWPLGPAAIGDTFGALANRRRTPASTASGSWTIDLEKPETVEMLAEMVLPAVANI